MTCSIVNSLPRCLWTETPKMKALFFTTMILATFYAGMNYIMKWNVLYLYVFEFSFNQLPLSGFAFKCFQGGIDGVDDERTKLTISEIDCVEGVTKCLRRQAGNLLIYSQILINQLLLFRGW